MKTAKYPGFYDQPKVDDAIQEAMDFVAVEMFLADEGWAHKIIYLDTNPGQTSIDLPISASMITEVRYLFANVYTPMSYDQDYGNDQYSTESGVRQWNYKYRVVENALYFNPPMAEGGEKYIQLEYMAYPKRLQENADFMESQFDNCMIHFIKYRAASILAASIEKSDVPWAGLEQSWYQKMLAIVIQRNQQSVPIKDFCGY